ncbi:MAG: hypothetical protein MUO26_07640 [Methanotrichaceae archaeon]|nr:hypothetical protein [Methanotrichaceae archaeon]
MEIKILIVSLLLLAALGFLPVHGEDVYFADAQESPGRVYSSPISGTENIYYERPAANLYSFFIHPTRQKLYYVNANDNKIYMSTLSPASGWTPEEAVYTNPTYIKDIAFAKDPDGNQRIFFSEATGSTSNGKIYWLDSTVTPVLYYEVPLEAVDGFWSGDFAFDDGGTLYLSSGNINPASIYRVEGGSINRIYSDTEPIKGLTYKDGSLYYAEWGNKIFQVDLATMAKNDYRSQPGHGWLSDVGF